MLNRNALEGAQIRTYSGFHLSGSLRWRDIFSLTYVLIWCMLILSNSLFFSSAFKSNLTARPSSPSALISKGGLSYTGLLNFSYSMSFCPLVDTPRRLANPTSFPLRFRNRKYPTTDTQKMPTISFDRFLRPQSAMVWCQDPELVLPLS